jgi:hypothetical protein
MTNHGENADKKDWEHALRHHLVDGLIHRGLYRHDELQAWAERSGFENEVRTMLADPKNATLEPGYIEARHVPAALALARVPAGYDASRAERQLKREGYVGSASLDGGGVKDPVFELRTFVEIRYARKLGYAVADGDLPIYEALTFSRMPIEHLAGTATNTGTADAELAAKGDVETLSSVRDQMSAPMEENAPRITRRFPESVSAEEITGAAPKKKGESFIEREACRIADELAKQDIESGRRIENKNKYAMRVLAEMNQRGTKNARQEPPALATIRRALKDWTLPTKS